MCRFPGGGQHPLVGAAACDARGVLSCNLDPAFELQCRVAVLPCLNQISSCNGQRLAGSLLITSQEYGDVNSIQRMILIERLQSTQHDHEPALHIRRARTTGLVPFSRELLKWTVGFKYRIHVPDQQHTLPVSALPLANQMSCALDLLHGNKATREPKLF